MNRRGPDQRPARAVTTPSPTRRRSSARFAPCTTGSSSSDSRWTGTGAACPPTGAGDPFPELAVREREILDLVAAGLGNAAIADRLALSPKTVADYLTSVFARLAVTDRSQAIVRARDAGLDRS